MHIYTNLFRFFLLPRNYCLIFDILLFFFFGALGIIWNCFLVSKHVQQTLDAGRASVKNEQLRTVQTQRGPATVFRGLYAKAAGVHRELSGWIATDGGPQSRTGIAQGTAGRPEFRRSGGHVPQPCETFRAVRVTATAAGQHRRTRGRRGSAGRTGGREGVAVGRGSKTSGANSPGREKQPGQNAMAQGLQQDRASAEREYFWIFCFLAFFFF